MATLLAARMACKLGGSSASTSASVYVSASGAADQTSGTAADIGWKALQQPEASRAALLQLLRDRGLSSANGHWLWTCRYAQAAIRAAGTHRQRFVLQVRIGSDSCCRYA
jgi:hypothetical protein